MVRYEWDVIDDSNYAKINEKMVQVNKDDDSYLEKMLEQNKKMIAYLQKENPKAIYAIRSHSHEWGMYEEVIELVAVEDEEEDDYIYQDDLLEWQKLGIV